MRPLPLSSGASSASAAFTGFEVIAPKIAASTFFRSSTVRAGKASPSLHQKSQPMSPWMYSASSSSASRTSRAASITSLPMPSPGSQAMRNLLMNMPPERRICRSPPL